MKTSCLKLARLGLLLVSWVTMGVTSGTCQETSKISRPGVTDLTVVESIIQGKTLLLEGEVSEASGVYMLHLPGEESAEDFFRRTYPREYRMAIDEKNMPEPADPFELNKEVEMRKQKAGWRPRGPGFPHWTRWRLGK